jgi:hypothetical protein
MRIPDARRSDAIAFACALDRNFDVLFNVVDCVAFPLVRIITERKLPPA